MGGARRPAHGFEDTRWRTAVVAACVLLSFAAPLRRTMLGAGPDAARASAVPGPDVSHEPLVAGLEVEAWVGILQREGLEGAGRRMRAMASVSPSGPHAHEASGLVARARAETTAGGSARAVDLVLLALTVDPLDPAVYTTLSEACAGMGDRACVERAERALARVVARRAR